MGQAKRRRASFLLSHPVCIFCEGQSLATTEDHQPARSLFDRKEWPEGYVFPACETCNQASKHDEQILALLVRINSEREDDPQRRLDFQKYVRAMNNNFPAVLKILTANQKRQFFKSERMRLPSGTALADLHMAGIRASDANRAFGRVLRKIIRALHWKHTGQIAPIDDRMIALQWYTNAYLHILEEEGGWDIFIQLPSQPQIKRTGHDLSDQFSYRYGVNEARDVSAFLLAFRHSVIATGLVWQTEAAFREWTAAA
ncbi:hypothetical protein [Nitrobacter sp.]|uniref:hypothetical protein n=1 Tax=Nitrobacter sp. TaxID=29420 RepID=UPI0029CAB5A8|nr:hypothetical protein [Nitrobacter sp.]